MFLWMENTYNLQSMGCKFGDGGVTSQDVMMFYCVIFVQNLILLLMQFAFLAVFLCFVFALSLSLFSMQSLMKISWS